MDYPFIFEFEHIYYPVLAAVGITDFLIKITNIFETSTAEIMLVHPGTKRLHFLHQLTIGNPIKRLTEVHVYDIYSPSLFNQLCYFLKEVNLLAIVILSRGKCGPSKCVTHYLVAMAVADLMAVIIEVILKRKNNIYLPINFLFITPICAMKLVTKIAALDCSVWFTVAFTFDRFVAICCPNLKRKHCTQRTANVVLGTVCVLGCLRSIPFYFMFEPQLIMNNIPYFCIETFAYYTSPLWAAYEWFDSILTPLVPIFLIILLNALTLKHIIQSNILRRVLLSRINNQNDPESENRKRSMILLFTISGNFILLWMTYALHSLRWRVKNYNYTDRYFSNPIYINQQTGYMLQLLSSCTNTCIYGLTQRKFREELKNGMK
ncbi:probable G-protein coupled receptor 139 [Heterodontus francisci]|uniref:probable G-protein coupled receptor 139 n=1 Tax=Heterodontus francisci TaxID=7792 RepID=UPI00355AD4A0